MEKNNYQINYLSSFKKEFESIYSRRDIDRII